MKQLELSLTGFGNEGCENMFGPNYPQTTNTFQGVIFLFCCAKILKIPTHHKEMGHELLSLKIKHNLTCYLLPPTVSCSVASICGVNKIGRESGTVSFRDAP